MFGWLFGKRKRKVIVRYSRGLTAIYAAYETQSGWYFKSGTMGEFKLEPDGKINGGADGEWKPYSGWPLSEFPVVPLENAKGAK